jgi:uncharacterized RDD family membrane protein YckC
MQPLVDPNARRRYKVPTSGSIALLRGSGERGPMFCSRCGLRVDEGKQVCQNCGQEVRVAAAASSNAAPSLASTSVSGPLPYAEFWIRFAAFLIDGLILLISFLISAAFILANFGVLLRRSEFDSRPGPSPFGAVVAMALVFLVSWVLPLLYLAGMESSKRQATIGKAAMSLQVTDLEGRRLTFGHATGRSFAKIISVHFLLGIGCLMAAFTEKKQALHDMIAGTLVLRKS